MIDYFDRLYSKLKYTEDGVLKLGWLYSVERTIVRKISNLLIPLYLKLSNKNGDSSNEVDVILSLTSFPLRAGKLWMVVESLLMQTVKAKRIIIWLSKEQFPSREMIPGSLLKYDGKEIEIRLVNGDIRSHKKYHYIVNEFPDSMFVTLDDDILYPSHMLEELIEAHNRYPEAVIARYAYEMEYDEDDNVLPYAQWQRVMSPREPSSKYFFGSGGGTLFPAGALHSDIKNIDLAMRLCPTADDVFLNAQCRRNNTKIAVVDSNVALLNVQYKEDRRLATDNVDSGNANDVQIANVNTYYQEEIF